MPAGKGDDSLDGRETAFAAAHDDNSSMPRSVVGRSVAAIRRHLNVGGARADDNGGANHVGSGPVFHMAV